MLPNADENVSELRAPWIINTSKRFESLWKTIWQYLVKLIMQKADIPAFSLLAINLKEMLSKSILWHLRGYSLQHYLCFLEIGGILNVYNKMPLNAHLKLLQILCYRRVHTYPKSRCLSEKRMCLGVREKGDIEKGTRESSDSIRMMGCHKLRTWSTLHMRFKRRKCTYFYSTTKNY